MVLFFWVITAFSNRSAVTTSFSSQLKTQSEFSINRSAAVVADAMRLPDLQKSCLQLAHDACANLYSETLKILADNSRISQCLVSLEKSDLLIKPLLLFRFYLHLLLPGSKEMPVLS
jgi:hypothetical protein